MLGRAEQRTNKDGPNTVDKHTSMAFDLWLFQVAEVSQIQLVFGRFLV